MDRTLRAHAFKEPPESPDPATGFYSRRCEAMSVVMAQVDLGKRLGRMQAVAESPMPPGQLLLRAGVAIGASLLVFLRLVAAAEPCHAEEPSPPADAQSASPPVLHYFRDWFPREARTQAEQPHWV